MQTENHRLSEPHVKSITKELSEILVRHARECDVQQRGASCYIEGILLETCLVLTKQHDFITDFLAPFQRFAMGEQTQHDFVEEVMRALTRAVDG